MKLLARGTSKIVQARCPINHVKLSPRDLPYLWITLTAGSASMAARGVGLILSAVEPMYDSLRREPRDQRLIQRLKPGAPLG